jgi:hypothetical protein
MIWHQAISVKVEVSLVKTLGENFEITVKVQRRQEGLLTLVSANNDMIKSARILQAEFSHSPEILESPIFVNCQA